MSSRSQSVAAAALLVSAHFVAAVEAQVVAEPLEPATNVPSSEPPPPVEAIEPEPAGDEARRFGEQSAGRDVYGVLISTGAAHDDGAPLRAEPGARTGDVDPNVYFGRVAFVVDRRPSERSGFGLAYEAEFERFGEGAELDALNHAFGVTFDHRSSERSRWLAGASLLDGEDPGRFLSGLLTVVPRSPYRQTRLHAGYEYLFRSSALSFSLGGLRTEIEVPPEPFVGAQDDTDLYAAVTYDRSLGAQHALSANYGYVRPDEDPVFALDALNPTGPPRVILRDPSHALALLYKYRPASGFAVEVGGGAAGTSDDVIAIGSLEVRKTSDNYAARARYDRSLAVLGVQSSVQGAFTPVATGLPDALESNAVTQALTLAVAFNFTERWQWEQSAWFARTDLVSGEKLESVSVSGRLAVRLLDRLGLFGEIDYFDQTGVAAPVTTRTRYGLGLVFGFGGPGGERGLLLQRESARKLLPGRGGV